MKIEFEVGDGFQLSEDARTVAENAIVGQYGANPVTKWVIPWSQVTEIAQEFGYIVRGETIRRGSSLIRCNGEFRVARSFVLHRNKLTSHFSAYIRGGGYQVLPDIVGKLIEPLRLVQDELIATLALEILPTPEWVYPVGPYGTADLGSLIVTQAEAREMKEEFVRRLNL
jgi:hypothetical protein